MKCRKLLGSGVVVDELRSLFSAVVLRRPRFIQPHRKPGRGCLEDDRPHLLGRNRQSWQALGGGLQTARWIPRCQHRALELDIRNMDENGKNRREMVE